MSKKNRVSQAQPLESGKTMLKPIARPAVLVLLILMAGCQGVSGLYREGFPGTAHWQVLPFINYSQAGNISAQLERMLVVLLPAAGIDRPVRYMDTAATGNGLAIGGAIQEWLIDRDGQPRVALELYISDARTGDRLWHISGARVGLPGESLYTLAQNLISELLGAIPVNRRQ